MKCFPVRTLRSSILITIPWERENRKFRTNQSAEFAIHAFGFLPRYNHWDAVTFLVSLIGDTQNVLRAEMNTNFTALTAFRDQVYLTAWNDNFGDIERGTSENSHRLVLFTATTSPWLDKRERVSRT
jgi:hypothetical protein